MHNRRPRTLPQRAGEKNDFAGAVLCRAFLTKAVALIERQVARPPAGDGVNTGAAGRRRIAREAFDQVRADAAASEAFIDIDVQMTGEAARQMRES